MRAQINKKSSQQSLRVLLLGAGRFAAMAAQEIEADVEARYRVIGVVEEDDVEMPAELAKYRRAGVPANIGSIVDHLKPDRILVALADRRGVLPALDLLKQQLRGVIVEEAAEVYEELSGKLAIERLQAGSQLFRDRFRPSLFCDRMSRAVSLLCGFVGLVVLAPLMALIAVAIKLDSPGPVLFRHKRIGLHGRPFELLKFRTMTDAKKRQSEWVADNANRITRVGWWLRRLRLDELTQFVNLLRGDMNLVGPRPHPHSNHDLFLKEIPFYALRCLVRPGLTGWAQIKYRYANNLAEETEKMRYDLYYIKHRSAWLDLQIIPATLMAVIAGKGATVEEGATAVVAAATMSTALTLVPAQATSSELVPYESLPEEERCGLDWIPGAAVLRWSSGAVAAGAGALVAGTGALMKGTAEVVVAGTGALVKGTSSAIGKTTALVSMRTRALAVTNR